MIIEGIALWVIGGFLLGLVRAVKRRRYIGSAIHRQIIAERQRQYDEAAAEFKKGYGYHGREEKDNARLALARAKNPSKPVEMLVVNWIFAPFVIAWYVLKGAAKGTWWSLCNTQRGLTAALEGIIATTDRATLAPSVKRERKRAKIRSSIKELERELDLLDEPV